MAEERKRVLVVDDENSVLDLLSRTLEGAGYEVFTATDGQDAFGKVLQHRIGVVLLDITMPGMSGMEVLKQITDHWPDTCVIMVTATADTGTAVEAMKMGAYDYITKPFNRDDVILRVNKAIEKRNLRLQDQQYKLDLQKRIGDQTKRLQEQFRDLVETLAREQNLLRLKSSRSQLSRLPKELRKPMSGVEEYRDAVIRMLKRET